MFVTVTSPDMNYYYYYSNGKVKANWTVSMPYAQRDTILWLLVWPKTEFKVFSYSCARFNGTSKVAMGQSILFSNVYAFNEYRMQTPFMYTNFFTITTFVLFCDSMKLSTIINIPLIIYMCNSISNTAVHHSMGTAMDHMWHFHTHKFITKPQQNSECFIYEKVMGQTWGFYLAGSWWMILCVWKCYVWSIAGYRSPAFQSMAPLYLII